MAAARAPAAGAVGRDVVPGHGGLLENTSPPAIATSDTALSGSFIARRAGNAWLVAETTAATHTRPTHPVHHELRITNLNIGQSS